MNLEGDLGRTSRSCCVGDVVRAWRALEAVTEAERAAIARSLGFDLRAPSVPVPHDPPPPPPPPPPPDPGHGAAPELPLPPPIAAQPESARVKLIEMAALPAERSQVLPDPLAGSTQDHALDHDPLVPLRWSRAWHALLGRSVAPRGTVDVPRALRIISAARPLRRIPRALRPAASRRVAVSVETRGVMVWLHHAALALVAELRRVHGARVHLEWLDDVTPAGVEPGVRHIVVGTFGRALGWEHGDDELRKAWAAFARQARRTGVSVVALCPADVSGARRVFGKTVAVVGWDERSSPRQAGNALRSAGIG